MQKHILLAIALTALLVLTAMYQTSTASVDSEFSEAQIERGRYLVREVAMCVQCHSPRNSRGELDNQRLLEGAPVPLKSPWPNRPWAFHAPAIAGLPGWTPQEMVHLMTTGSRLSGRIPRAPMPPFRMNREDATAITAYLDSLR